jgi:hypothetical protein
MTTETRQTREYPPQTQNGNEFITRRLRLAGTLIVIGGLVEALTLVWNHPLSFLAFAGIGALAMVIGVAVYLLALVSPGHKP